MDESKTHNIFTSVSAYIYVCVHTLRIHAENQLGVNRRAGDRGGGGGKMYLQTSNDEAHQYHPQANTKAWIKYVNKSSNEEHYCTHPIEFRRGVGWPRG